jgi:hypothetical protein
MDPANFYPLFPSAVKEPEQGGGLETFRRLSDRILIASDGTEYHCSNMVHGRPPLFGSAGAIA